ncbi:phytosulfokines-like [Senna tora]|uniref:Phytosulfokine n=1 Tax=Senna tora TaxID=362788 RepID=A0A834TU71_9FABA|nr:phytosulfokines-like [Senna tora]
MAKLTALFFTALFLSFMLSHASRPHPLLHEHSSSGFDMVFVGSQGGGVDAEDDKCGSVSEEECLMRRTLVAHLDYIYTQHHKP